MAGNKVTDDIYQKYSSQIDAILDATENNYTKAAEIVSWFYGGSTERWRKVLKNKKGKTMPDTIKEFLKLSNKK